MCAPSNNAADDLLRRITCDTSIPHQFITRVYSRFIERSHGSSYKGGLARAEPSFDIQPQLEEFSLHFKVDHSAAFIARKQPGVGQKAVDKAYEAAETAALRESRVVVTTCTTAYLHSALLHAEPHQAVRRIRFHTVVMDEAAQASEPDLVSAATHAAQRLVVVGDHQQLGPVVTQKNLCALYLHALEISFLERMLKDPARLRASVMLNVQHRMHPSIRQFPSKRFYESKLLDKVSIPFRPELQNLWPQEREHCCFVDCETPHSMNLAGETSQEGQNSLKNVGEAEIAALACSVLLQKGCSPAEIAIITPYAAQHMEIRAKLDKATGVKSRSLLVGTVHALQGSEREFIIFSCVRSFSQEVQDISSAEAATRGDSVALHEMCERRLGIVANPKLLNVALTRAKYGLICIGNADVLKAGSEDFRDLIESLRGRNCVVDRDAFVKSLRGNLLRRVEVCKSQHSVPTVHPEDSCSNVGARDAVRDDIVAGSEVSNAPSSISVLSNLEDGPKCFVRGTLLPAASGHMVRVECLEQGSPICSARDPQSSLRVKKVQRHDNETVDLVQIEAGEASIVVTGTHRVVMETGPPRPANEVKKGSKVCITGGAAASAALLPSPEHGT